MAGLLLAGAGCGGDAGSTPGGSAGGAGGVSGTSSSSGASGTGGAGGVTSSSSTSSSSSGASGGAGGSGCADACPAPNAGISWGCEKRFMYGTNWAWRNWGADFGGVAAWGSQGVVQASAMVSSEMQQMKAAGVSVIRWWMWPRFLTDSIVFGPDDAPSGIGGSLLADVQKALELAEQNDVYIMFTPFSFDNFGPTALESGIDSRGIKLMVTDPARRKELLDNLVAPVAHAVEQSPYKKRMIAWDMINEPEWAITGPDLYGGEDFTPDAKLEAVTHAEMETFLKEMAAVLHANSGALVSIGGAAIKWPKAWSQVDVDFYQFHYYDWIYRVVSVPDGDAAIGRGHRQAGRHWRVSEPGPLGRRR